MAKPIDPKQILARLKAQFPENGANDPGDSGIQPPVASAMTIPQNGDGDQLQAKVMLRIALDLLQKVQNTIPPKSPLAQKLMAITTSIANAIGLSDSDRAGELIPAQLKMMMAQLPQNGNATPGQKAAQATPQVLPPAGQQPPTPPGAPM